MFKKIAAVMALVALTLPMYGEAAYDKGKYVYNETKTEAGAIAYAAEDGLYIVGIPPSDVESPACRSKLLVGGKNISSPLFSTDGGAIAYRQGGSLYAFNLYEKKSRLLIKDTDSFCQGTGSSFFASSGNEGIISVDCGTGERKTLVRPEKDLSYLGLKTSPDMKRLAYTAMSPAEENKGRGGLWLYEIQSGKKNKAMENDPLSSTSLGMYPIAGKWSPDSKTLFIWLFSYSGSLSADGTGAAVYDPEGPGPALLDTTALAYEENISFADDNLLVLVTGAGREMFKNKRLGFFNVKTGDEIDKPIGSGSYGILPAGMTAASPCFSSDGNRLLFTASPEAAAGDDYKVQKAELWKRQVYLYTNGSLSRLTRGSAYRSEAPVFLDDRRIIFARIGRGGEYSIWSMDTVGNGKRKLAAWKYKDQEDDRALDFYGRINWSRMYSLSNYL